ncbi:hypothetical protein B0H16DRAFT_873419 [Mycena metata]|uniref:Uncharacterized protein n=1 Tax=Mycena metata TaxID=1033252 RepID=A0AAD7IU20_9AGAR|nr:hypothetical protein B0H16DRAFT_873419 [Mycena metata]
MHPWADCEFRTLHKIHTFIEAQQNGSKVKKFFRQGELSGLLKDCKAGLQQGLEFFQVRAVHTKVDLPIQNSMQMRSLNMMSTAREMEEQAQMTQRELLNMVDTISSSDTASLMSRSYSGSYQAPLLSQCCRLSPKYCTITFKSTGGVTRDRFDQFDISTAPGKARDKTKNST